MCFPLIRSPFFIYLFLLILCLFIFFNGIGSYGLLDKDEPRYCGCALEMLENNDFIVPKFNFQDRFDKPVLFYWLIAASYKIFGVSDFSSRLPSGICAILCVLFTFYVGKNFFCSAFGFISAMVLASSLEFVLLGRRAATDMTLCLFFSSCLYSLFLGYFVKDTKLKIFWVIVSGIFAGLSILTKGPVGILLPLIILSGFLLVRRQMDIKHLKIYFLICLIAVIIALPWYFQVHQITEGRFTDEFLFKHNLNRYTSVVGEHPGPVWFYIPVLFGGFMPWSFCLIGSLFLIPRKVFNKSFNKFIAFCFVWFLIIFLFFSVSTTKLATYILLLFPPASFMSAYWICILGRKKIKALKLVFLGIFVVLIPLIYYGLFLILKWKIDSLERNMLLGVLILCILVMILGLILTMIFSKKYCSSAFYYALAIIIPLVFGLNTYLIKYYKYTHEDLRNFAILAKNKNAHEVISFGMYRPSLVYYSRTPVDFQNKNIQVKKIKQLISSKEKKNVFIIGHSSDVKKHKVLFERINILDMKAKYFIGQIN